MGKGKEQTRPAKAGRQKFRIHEITAENDIRYQGPLSYQHFQIFGWLCIVLSSVLLLVRLVGRLDSDFAARSAGILPVLNEIASFSVPFLLIANFTQILNAVHDYRKQLIKNIAAMAGISGLYYLFFYRYLVGGVEALITDPSAASPMVESMFGAVVPNGFLCFNLFVDLLLCTLVMLFLNYRPVHLFKGKTVYFFRLLTLLPIGYEIACMALKVQAARGVIRIPVWAYPLLPVKPPMTFVLFIALAVFVKTRELRFRRHGKTHEEYLAFLKTRKNSWNFSVFLAIMMVIISIIDLFVVLGFSVNESLTAAALKAEEAVTEEAVPETAGHVPAGPEETAGTGTASDTAETAYPGGLTDKEMQTAALGGMFIAFAAGFGDSVYLAFLAPIVLLFSYTRVPKNQRISMLIPAAGIVLIMIVMLEGIHTSLYHLPVKKLDLQVLMNSLKEVMPNLQ